MRLRIPPTNEYSAPDSVTNSHLAPLPTTLLALSPPSGTPLRLTTTTALSPAPHRATNAPPSCDQRSVSSTSTSPRPTAAPKAFKRGSFASLAFAFAGPERERERERVAERRSSSAAAAAAAAAVDPDADKGSIASLWC